jgi:hypothetical protein
MRGNQAYALWAAGRFDEAERSSRAALAIFDRVLGPNNSASIVNQRLLGIELQDAGHFAEAAAVFEANSARAVRFHGAHDTETALNQSYSLAPLIIVGRVVDAESIGRQAVADAQAKPGLTASEVLSIKRRLGLALIFSGKVAEAADLLREIDVREQASGAHDARHATTLLYEAGAQTALHHFEAAAQLAQKS